MDNILKKLKNELTKSRKKGDKNKITNISTIIGEIQRSSKKDLKDSEIVMIIKKLYKLEKERLSRIDLDQSKRDIEYIELLKSFLPEQLSDHQIRTWINQNIDFSKFKNNMQAMKPIMKHFGNRVDGNLVKKIILTL